MNRILLAAAAVALGVVIVVFFRPDETGSGTALPAAAGTDAVPAAAPSGRSPLDRGLPPIVEDDASGGETAKLSPEQKRAMHRLIQAYQKARTLVEDVESSEAIKRAQDGEGETERFATDREGIQAAIQSQIEEIKTCYEAWLGLNPELSGRIVTNFAIEAPEEDSEEARVVGVNVREGGLGNKFVEGCVLSVLSDLQFERPDERIEVNYPFTFRAAPPEE